MFRSLFWRILWALVGVIVTFVLVGSAALAQGETPTPTASASTSGTQSGTVPMSTSDLVRVFPWLFFFGGLVLAALFLYMWNIQRRYYDVFERLSLAGRAPRTMIVSLVSTPADGQKDITSKSLIGEPAQHLTVEGPLDIVLGGGAVAYTAKVNGVESAVSWSTASPDIVDIKAPGATSSTALVTPKIVGLVNLTAKTDTNLSVDFPIQVVSLVGSDGGVLPVVAQGFGSIIVALVLMIILVVLGLSGVLSGEAIATIVGALVGYVFGVNASSTQSSTGK